MVALNTLSTSHISPNAELPSAAVAPEALLSVGAAAERLGIAPATLRSWGRRYGLVPEARTEGGHRRFTSSDMKRLLALRELIGTGMTGRAAAQIVQALPDTEVPDAWELSDSAWVRERSDHGLMPPLELASGLDPAASTLARSAGRLDSDSMMGQVADLCIRTGVISTWSEVVMPVLAAAGSRWAQTGQDVDVEHALSEAVMAALTAYRAFLPRPPAHRPVLLACSSADWHTLTLHAVAAALTENHVPVRMLGGNVPLPVLMSAASRTRARSVFLWRQIVGTRPGDQDLASRTRSDGVPPFFLGGPGWDQFRGPRPGVRVFTLAEAADLIPG